MEVAAVATRFMLASLFLLAAASKLPRRDEFEQAVRKYDVLPGRLARPVAQVLPIAELFVGLALTAGAALRVFAAVVAVMLFVFTVAVALALLAGRQIDCGCFSSVAPRRITWRTVGRNLVLLAMAIVLAWEAPRGLSIDQVIGGGEPVPSNSDVVAVMIASTATLAVIALARTGSQVRRLARTATGEKGG